MEYIHSNLSVEEKAALDRMNYQSQVVNSLSQTMLVRMAENGLVDDETATENIYIFAEWQPNIAYLKGALRTYTVQGESPKLYRCVQAHTSQANWTPDVTASLWSLAGDPNLEFPPWHQPIGAHNSYNKNSKVSHKEKNWLSEVNNNVWEPGVYGWIEQ